MFVLACGHNIDIVFEAHRNLHTLKYLYQRRDCGNIATATVDATIEQAMKGNIRFKQA